MVNIVSTVDNAVKISRVLVSVSDKSGLDVLIPGLLRINHNIHFYSTGGTYRRIAEIYSRGQMIVEAMPEWRPRFRALFEKLEALADSRKAAVQ